MAGWLAWNLRIVTGVAIALCGYYGADYWSNKDTERNIERIHFQDQQWQEEDIITIKSLTLGEQKPTVAKKYFKKMNSSSGGGVTGSEKLMEETERKCRENPDSLIYGSDLIDRRYCRLYWSVKEDINILVKTENEHLLLSETNSKDDEWKPLLQKYQTGPKPWGEITEGTDGKVPAKFKDLCKEKAKESVYDTSDTKYVEVTEYCTRKKTIKDVLDEKNIVLLETNGNDDTWKSRFSEYKSSPIGEKFRDDQSIKSGDYTGLQRACAETIKFETTVQNYKNFRSVVERYCKK